MKKIFYIFIILSSFFFIDNVSALGEEVEPYFDFDSIGSDRFHAVDNSSIDFRIPSVQTLPSEKQDNYDLALQYLEIKCSNYDSYSIINGGYSPRGYDNQIELLCFNQSNNQFKPSISISASFDGTKYMNISIYYNLYKSDTVNYYYARFINNKEIEENLSLDNNIVSSKFYYDGWYSYSHIDFPILNSNIDFSFSNNYPTNVTLLSSFKYNDVIYNIGDFGYKDGVLYDKSKDITPTILITKENENKVTILEKEYITDVTLKIDFGTIDNDKYLYMYKYGAESEWSTITLTENTYITKTYSENNTLYVQVLDRTNYEVVSSNTFIVSSIEKLPDNYVYDNVDNDTVNTDDKVIWHKCDLSLENGVALCEVTLKNYNNELYDYYYKIDNSSYSKIVPDEKTEVLPEVYDTSLFLKTNDDISLYQKWKKSTDNFVSYDFVVKLYHNSTITLMRETKDTGFKQYYTFTVTMLTEKNDMNQIEQFIYNHLLSKFYFIHQFKQIIEYVSSYNFEENAKAPRFTFDMSFIGLSPINVDMTISEHTRLLIHGYIKLFASITVVVSFIRETSKLFKK